MVVSVGGATGVADDVSSFCAGQLLRGDSSFANLTQSAAAFLQRLDLPAVHPHCSNEGGRIGSLFEKMRPLPEDVEFEWSIENEGSFCWESIVTTWFRIAPPLLAMSELWLRLFACFLAPIILLRYVFANTEPTIRLLVVGLASATVLATDTFYVHAWGSRAPGMSALVLMVSASCIRHTSKTKDVDAMKEGRKKRRMMITVCAFFVGLTFVLVWRSDGNGAVIGDDRNTYNNAGLDIPSIQEGLYFSPAMRSIVDRWPERNRSYRECHYSWPWRWPQSWEDCATPYLPTGDSKTGIPFLINEGTVPNPTYHRVWLTGSHGRTDHEALALDVAFPVDGHHRNDRPVLLILHGLNGGSHEEYVKDFINRATSHEGGNHTCVVMVARGLMDAPIRGWNVFHGARVTDTHEAARALRKALKKGQMLGAVGYSMGAIVLSNYMARHTSSSSDMADRVAIDAAFAISGGLDMREQLNLQRSKRLWQPMLAQELREKFILQKFSDKIRKRLTEDQYRQLMRAISVTDIDKHAIVTYNGFDSLLHYYTEMSAMGDSNAYQSKGRAGPIVGRVSGVSRPFCVLHALDDPLITWRTMGHDPWSLVEASPNIMLLLTHAGGHVGWPLGLNPKATKWKWMNEAALTFMIAVDADRKNK